MADLEAVEGRATNLGVIQDIVHAMRALSAVQYRHATEALTGLRDYADVLRGSLSCLPDLPAASPQPARTLLLVLGADQGLCGPLTRQLLDAALARAEEMGASLHGIYAVGRRTHDQLRDAGRSALGWHSAPSTLRGVDTLVDAIGEVIHRVVTEQSCDAVELAYARLLGIGGFEPTIQRVFPVDRQSLSSETRGRAVRVPILYEPARVSAALREEWTFLEVYRAAVESLGAEHGARLRTTDAASQTLSRKLEELRLEHNRLRQELITEELQEIIRGAEEATRDAAIG